MSYDDDTMHLVFKYNEEYENDLEIHKSATIQGLITRKAIEGAVEAVALEMERFSTLGGAIAPAAQDPAASAQQLNTVDDRSGFQNGATANNLLMQDAVSVMQGQAAAAEPSIVIQDENEEQKEVNLNDLSDIKDTPVKELFKEL